MVSVRSWEKKRGEKKSSSGNGGFDGFWGFFVERKGEQFYAGRPWRSRSEVRTGGDRVQQIENEVIF